MAVPSAITDLSTTVASNSPAGSESPSLIDDYLRAQAGFLAQMYSGNAPLLSSVAGTDTITGTVTPTPTAYAAGQVFRFISAGANTTTAVTLNVSSLGAKSVTKLGANALAAGDIPAGAVVQVVYDGTRFQIIGLTSQIAAAINTMTSPLTITVNGTTPLTVDTSGNISLPLGTANQVQYLNGSKVLSGSANLTFDGTTLTPNALTVTNAVTLNGGTANGVPYLNASKVLTSGSALTFDGTTFGVLAASGVSSMKVIASGTTQASLRLGSTYSSGGGNTDWALVQAFSAYGDLVFRSGLMEGADPRTSGTTRFQFLQDGTAIWSPGGSEVARMTSTGLGIGTSSPYWKLSVSDGTVNGGMIPNGGNLYFGTKSNHPVLFRTNDTDRMTLDSSGNLGLGVTPSAWGAGQRGFDVGSAYGLNASATGGASFSLSQNAYYNGANWIYKNNNPAARYDQNSGAHAWHIAASGLGGNAITFTQAMALDASGNLSLAGGYYSTNRGSASTAYRVGISLEGNGSTTDHVSPAIAFSGNNVNAAIWSSRAGGGYGGNLIFATQGLSVGDPTERARIDSSGNLLVGTTNTSASVGSGFKVLPTSNGANNPQIAIVTSASANTTSSFSLYSTGAGAYRFYVGDGGTVYATSTSISAISDQTLKENVRDLETGLPEVMALKPRRFDWKNGDAQNVAGFVAQEVEQVLPELVTDYVYGKDEDGADIIKKSLKMGDILPTLVKAIQEQQALINAQAAALESLTSRIAALEAK